jgi:hypothetical protein
MPYSSITSILPTQNPELSNESKSSSCNWKTLTKAGLVFVTTTGAFLALKTTGSFNLISSLWRNSSPDADLDESSTLTNFNNPSTQIYTAPASEEQLLTTHQYTKREPSINETFVKIGPEFQVNTYTTSDQNYPFVAGLSDGKFVVAWMSDGQDGYGYGVYGQMFNANGTKFLSEFLVNTYTTGGQYYPSIAELSDSKFVITWQCDYDGSYAGVYGQMFNADGTKYSQEFQVNTYTTNTQGVPSAIGLNNGKFVVTWVSYGQDGDDFGIYGQLFNADSSKYLSEFQVNTYTINAQGLPSITSLSNNKFVVTWWSVEQDGDNYGIYGQMFNADSSKYLSEFQVNTYTTNSQFFPDITRLNNSKFVVTWHSSGQDGNDDGIYGQIFNANGTKYSQEFQVNTYTTNSQSFPSITNLNNGKFLITWQSNWQDGSNYGIYGQMFNVDGSRFSQEFQVNTHSTDNQERSHAAGLNDNKFIVIWASDNQDGDGYGIYGQLFKIDIAPLLINNNLIINKGERVTLTTNNLSATDVDDDDNDLTFTVSNVQNGQFELKSNPGTPIVTFTQQQIIDGNIQFVHDGSTNPPSYDIAVSDGSLSTSPLPGVVTFSLSESSESKSKTSESVSKITSKEISSTQAFSDTSNSATTSTSKSLLATILGSLGGIFGTITSILGVWLKYKRYRAINKLRQQSLLAAEVQRHLNLDVSDFQSKQGQRYVKIINGIVRALQEQGTLVEEMDKEELHNLTLRSVEVIKEEVEPNRTLWRKTIPVKGLKRAKDSIIKGIINKYHEGKDKDGIALQSIQTHEADISGNKEICKSGEGRLLGMKNVQRVPFKELELGDEIGEGGFGKVYRATWQENDVVAKVLKEGIADLPIFMGDFLREAATWSKLNHPNITRFFGICWTKPSPYIVVEYVNGGSLSSRLKKKDLSLVQRFKLAMDTVRGLRYLHEYDPPILHRDIKPDNVLVEQTWDQNSGQWLLRGKVTDFGTSRHAIISRLEEEKQKLTAKVGTPPYQAPEIIRGDQNYASSADIYSLGITFNELYTQEEPYSDRLDLFKSPFTFFKAVVEEGTRPTIPDEMPKNYATLIRQCWSKKPSKRPNTREIEHRLKPIVNEQIAQECSASGSKFLIDF